MEEVAVMETTESPQDRLAKGPSLAKLSTGEDGKNRLNCSWRSQAASPRSSYMQRGLGGLPRLGSRSARLPRQDMSALSDKLSLRKREAKKEILRRALTPPAKRPTLRWLDFRPTPSRLSNMSMA